jgi:hypothetical protein
VYATAPAMQTSSAVGAAHTGEPNQMRWKNRVTLSWRGG